MVLIFIVITLASLSFSESFQQTLIEKRAIVESAIGKNKLRKIEIAMSKIEIKRITQLLTINGIGKKTVFTLNEILGTRFDYDFEQEICSDNS